MRFTEIWPTDESFVEDVVNYYCNKIMMIKAILMTRMF
jgi:hypothetical protein